MKIVVLAGGISTERDVSLSSGKKIYEAIKRSYPKTILLDVYLGYDGDIDIRDIFDADINWSQYIGDIKEECPDLEQIREERDSSNVYFGPNAIEICQEADIVFIALHGENGENGKLQAAFDLLGIQYTGTDYLSAALTMDKGLTKELFIYHGIPTPKYYKISSEVGEKPSSMESSLSPNLSSAEDIPYPKVVKIADGGSSIGVYIVKDELEYRKALEAASTFGCQIIVEEYIAGREFSVGILDGKALPVIEIIPKVGFYDYKNKYQVGFATEICPAELSIEKTEEMQRLAEKVFKVLRLKIYGRIDFLMSNTEESIYCIEANNLPGMTPTSLLPQEAKVIGLDYDELCLKIIELSLAKVK